MSCTGHSAFWCPICGDCTCERAHDGECCFDGKDCPLHGVTPKHAETVSLDECRLKIGLLAAEQVPKGKGAILTSPLPERMRALVKKWRHEATLYNLYPSERTRPEDYAACADELEAALAESPVPGCRACEYGVSRHLAESPDPTPIHNGEIWRKIDTLAKEVLASHESNPEQEARRRLDFDMIRDAVNELAFEADQKTGMGFHRTANVLFAKVAKARAALDRAEGKSK